MLKHTLAVSFITLLLYGCSPTEVGNDSPDEQPDPDTDTPTGLSYDYYFSIRNIVIHSDGAPPNPEQIIKSLTVYDVDENGIWLQNTGQTVDTSIDDGYYRDFFLTYGECQARRIAITLDDWPAPAYLALGCQSITYCKNARRVVWTTPSRESTTTHFLSFECGAPVGLSPQSP